MKTRKLGPFDVSEIGLGCMSLSHAYGPPPPRDQAEAVLLGALDAGCTFFDTAAVYGLGHNERLVGEVLRPHRDRVVLASKCGLSRGEQRELNGHPDVLKATCEESLQRLGVEVIDLYYLHRWDRRVPIEDSVAALADLVAEGKIRTIGLSEVSAPTLRRAHAVHPIAALQTEYSPWTRNPEIAVLEACRELGVTFVAFSPVGRGFLAGGVKDPSALDPSDFRVGMPRFKGDAFQSNLALLAGFEALAGEAGCTPAQLCLAWLLHKDPDLIPIPGTSSPEHMRQNMAASGIALPASLVERIDLAVNGATVSGPRYAPAMQASVDTERMPFEVSV
ncbi:aldo/keto reductase [Phenylobacterium sp.]|uniref:aldo/keto reductase n=1 Tax=Phenylobacterium sp. TaxID=1871053 RepID=UPI0025DDEB1C|nr:aldo/keto reductase [Phenylobacterium sp.]MCA6286055.1 aldo/keto reductase [Phenylobacterium sp.]MCA6309742.1 aldo/keto reductase [Phenylobacterium sp.]MCA6323529.1 aldo/keto reductase [Phenylobacterium sp.]MCA6336148.1 aldo/keto reductase [Phenylobacterium sp.]MCA6338893.1 aldo/keto reductase [Phenylobacterium sp.]